MRRRGGDGTPSRQESLCRPSSMPRVNFPLGPAQRDRAERPETHNERVQGSSGGEHGQNGGLTTAPLDLAAAACLPVAAVLTRVESADGGLTSEEAATR